MSSKPQNKLGTAKISASVLLVAASLVASPAPLTAADYDAAKVTKGGDTATSRKLKIAINKSAVIDLPADAADVMITNPTIADAVIRTARRSFVLGMKVGTTNAYFFDANGKQILNLEIEITRDTSALNDSIRRLLPGSKIVAEAVNNSIILSGEAKSASEVDQAVRLAGQFVDKPTEVVSLVNITGKDQVLLKVRVVEMQRTIIKQLGLDLTGTISLDSFASGVFGNLPGFSVNGVPANGFNANLSWNNNGRDGGLRNANGVVTALERVGLMRTLAEPNLTAISGESAKFLAGGEFPVPVAQGQDGEISIQFKPFGVGLGFTPVVLSEGRISLRISTEVSELSNEGSFQLGSTVITDKDGNVTGYVEGQAIPALKVRRAETTVELPSGGGLVMAGLIQENTRQAFEGLPGAKDLPVLGALLRSRDFQRSETELVVIVTPYLVEGTSPDKFKVPGEGFAAAGDASAIFLGRLNEIYATPNAKPEKKPRGPFGFIFD